MKVKKRWRYFCHICAIILILANSIFLLANITDLQININESTILLSVIGFLFAFAAINIYSIFNANVDEQREKLDELIDQYDKRFINDRKQLKFITSIVRFQTRLHAISSTKRFIDHSQFLEWISESQEQLDTFIGDLTNIHNSVDKDMFDYLHSELMFVLRDARPLIEAKKKDVEGDEFWKGRDKIKDTKKMLIDDIGMIIEKIKGVEAYDFENQRSFSEQNFEKDESTLCKKISDAIINTIKDYKLKRPKGKRK